MKTKSKFTKKTTRKTKVKIMRMTFAMCVMLRTKKCYGEIAMVRPIIARLKKQKKDFHHQQSNK